MKAWLKSVVEESATPAGKAFSLSIQFLIIISLIEYAIETLPDLRDSVKAFLRSIEYLTVAVFSVEYLLRIYVADNRRRFICSFYGLVDLIAILPFYLALGIPYVATHSIDLRFLRIVRLMRLFRVLKLVRYSKALQLYSRAFSLAKEELLLFFLAAAMLLYFAAAGIHFFEHDKQPDKFSSLFHSLWWAVVTLTSVGYGDVYPITLGGRIFTFFLLLIGLGTIAVPSGIVASALGKARELLNEEEAVGTQDETTKGSHEPP